MPVLLAQFRQLVRLDRLALRLRIDAEQLRRIKTENLILDLSVNSAYLYFLMSSSFIFSFRTHNLTLRTAGPDAVGTPQDVIGAGDLDHLSEHVQRPSPDCPTTID